MYNFDELVDRTGTGAAKWDHRAEAVKAAHTVPLSTADMEFRCPPAVIAAAAEAARRGIYGYTDADDEYYDALKNFMCRRHNCEIERDWTVITNGVVSGIALCVQTLTEPGDGIIIQPPVYGPFGETVDGNKRTLLDNPLVLTNGRYEVDFDDLERLCSREDAKLFIICNPHNPVGRVWTVEELNRIAEICRRHGVFIVSDEIHSDLILRGYKHTSMLNIPAAEGNCVVCTAVSKSFNVPGLSCSDMFVREEQLRKKILERQDINNAYGMNYFARFISIAAHNGCDEWLDEVNGYITDNYLLMRDFMEERLPMLKLTEMEGTYLAWLDMRALGIADDGMKDFCVNKANLSLVAGNWFGTGGQGFTRWNIAMPRAALKNDIEHFAAAVEALGDSWHNR